MIDFLPLYDQYNFQHYLLQLNNKMYQPLLHQNIDFKHQILNI